MLSLSAASAAGVRAGGTVKGVIGPVTIIEPPLAVKAD